MNLEEIVEKAKNGDINSKEEIINRFTPLIIKHSRTTFIVGYDENDLKQIGYMTIIQAIKRYDSKKAKILCHIYFLH